MLKAKSLIFEDVDPKVKSAMQEFPRADPVIILESFITPDIAEVEEIIFEDIEIPKISLELKELIEQFKNVHSLGFNRCGLKSLDNLPELTNIGRFSADGNSLTGKSLAPLIIYPKLFSLSVMNNRIQEGEDKLALYKLLSKMNIFSVNLNGNPVANYQREMFLNFKSIVYVDNLQSTGDGVFYDFGVDKYDLARPDGKPLLDNRQYANQYG